MIDTTKIESFKNEIIAVCKKYGFSIAHEAQQGAFIIVRYNDYCVKWFKRAYVELND